MLSGDVVKVEFVLKLRVHSLTWDAMFNFQLDPVSLERIDILESKLRDQQDELKKIAVLETTVQKQQEELKKMQKTADSVVELVHWQYRTTLDHTRIKCVRHRLWRALDNASLRHLYRLAECKMRAFGQQ